MQLQAYISHKTVHAAEITDIADHSIIVKAMSGFEVVECEAEMFTRFSPQPGDFLVVYADGYKSFSPRAPFIEGYMPKSTPHAAALVNNNFGWAVERLQAGAKVAREGWNGKGMFLFLVPGSQFKVNRPPLLGIYPEGTVIDYHPHIDMKTAHGYVVPWLASQADMLAADWQEVA